MDVETCLASVETTVQDADAALSTDLADHREHTSARLWRGQVLVDWEPDPHAGGCLVRPALLRRLLALHATASWLQDGLTFRASGRVVAALSPEHADLVRRLGGARVVELQLKLRFDDGQYVGGDETYMVVERGARVPLLRLRAEVRSRSVTAKVARDEVIGPSRRV